MAAKPAPTSTKHASTSPALPTPTIPPGCEFCYPSNATHTCFQNTQCVPIASLCNALTNPCPSSSYDPTDPVDCLDQICSDEKSLPLPFPILNTPVLRTTPKLDELCFPGNFSSLSQTISSSSQYIFSCVLRTPNGPVPQTNCSDWEYAFQGSCFLRTCGGPSTAGATFMGCLDGYNCKKHKSTDQYGLCIGDNDTDPYGSSGDGDSDDGYGSSAGQYSSKEYLLQGLLIGVCSLILGVGMAVGIWHYRMKKKREALEEQRGRGRRRSGSGQSVSSRQNSIGSNRRQGQQEQGQDQAQAGSGSRDPSTSSSLGPSSSTTKSHSWLSTVFSCGRRRPGVFPRARGGQTNNNRRRAHSTHSLHRDSFADTGSQEDDEDDEEDGGDSSNNVRRSSSNVVTGRWRWGPGSSSQMLTRGMGPGLAIVPEMDPPPMYQTEPGLPTYNSDDIGMTRIQGTQEGLVASTMRSLDDPGHEHISMERLQGPPSTVVIPMDDHTTETSTSTTTTTTRTMPSTNNILPEETHLPTMPSLQPIPTHNNDNNNSNQTHIISEPGTAHLPTKED
ncbi:hypothetical protein MVEG_05837 [Podila verticillata NRRL 6337]|nr:hypothetical protein MVEG_05837 [Podila verticillata NRRL 6337]